MQKIESGDSMIHFIPEIHGESREILLLFPKVLQIRKLCLSLHNHTIKRKKTMATIVLQVPDESMVTKVKQACKMLMGVASVKVQKTPSKVEDITKTTHYKAAMDDVKNGRVYHATNVDDMFDQILG